MNYEETREQVDMILGRVKALDNAKKIQLRRAYNVSFDELRGFQQITIKNILKDTPWCSNTVWYLSESQRLKISKISASLKQEFLKMYRYTQKMTV